VGCHVEVTDVDVTQYLVKMCLLIIVYFVGGNHLVKYLAQGSTNFHKKI